MSVIRVGSNKNYADGWSAVFGKAGGGKKGAAAKKAGKKSAKKKVGARKKK